MCDSHHIEAVIEILAEFALGDEPFEILIGRGHHAHVGGDRLVAADPFERAFAQRAQELDLRAGVDLANFVQKKRAAVGLFEAPDAPFASRQ